ncbi:MAG: FliM/FliN family flagellar motor switch protein [Planctomycetes bacterium]|nr:FliM/FliN family flagellar motor switch protein [Planctomycetota bacterium]
MIVDQDEIDALLAEADSVVAELGEDATALALAEDAPEPPPPPPPRPLLNVTPEVARILKIRVPLRVQLASRQMSIAEVRKLSLGTIIEFHKPIAEPLELLINNHPVGNGDAVKVGQRFGVRISEMRDAATRIRSMGK